MITPVHIRCSLLALELEDAAMYGRGLIDPGLRARGTNCRRNPLGVDGTFISNQVDMISRFDVSMPGGDDPRLAVRILG